MWSIRPGSEGLLCTKQYSLFVRIIIEGEKKFGTLAKVVDIIDDRVNVPASLSSLAQYFFVKAEY
jgi:hypothetical protein